MTNTTMKRASVLLVFAFVVFLFGYLTTEADEPKPSPADHQNLVDIRQNQEVIEKNRPAYEAFLKAKAWNETETEALEQDGWCVSWNEDPDKIGLERCPVHAAGYDLDKLAKAVAMHETGDCTAKVGSALYNNCHGFRKNNKFLHFKAKQESYVYFEDLWQRNYGGFPDLRLATAYVCGWQHLKKNGTGTPCSGGNPNSWLSSVTNIYDNL